MSSQSDVIPGQITGQLPRLLLFVISAFLGLPQAHALVVHYDTTRDARLKVCDEHSYAGRRDAARACYEQLLGSADESAADVKAGSNRREGGVQPGVHVRANAAAALSDVRLANRLFREAAADSDDPAIKTDWGRLYLETHQTSDALSLFREALLYDDTWLPARLGLAAAMTESFEGRAREELIRITAENPDSIEALLLLARIELELQNLAAARGLLNRALLEAESQSVTPLEIYALHAGANLLDDEPIKPWVNKALALNPIYGDVFNTAAHFYIITYRYREAVELYQRAVDTDPELAAAHRDLGINLLRLNSVFGARYHLEKAFGLDGFDAQTVNTLRLLDKLDGMRLSAVDVPDPERPGESLGRVLVRLDEEDADALEPYVIDLSIRAVQLFTRRYDFRLRQPMIVELYHDHDDFGVRTVSTPGIGLLGVTFGYLTAMDSPKARANGEFHWGSTLWHEIAHVFTLEATNHRLPRWFSEGLSVYEEWNTGPLPDRELPLETLSAMEQDRLLPIAELDLGFVRPSYEGQVQVSYMQAGLICDFIATRWGHQALVTMLEAFADRKTVETALAEAVELDSKAFDREFQKHLDVTFSDIIDGLEDYRVASRQLGRAIGSEDWISVEALARDMIRRYPQRVGSGSPYEVLAQALREQGDDKGAISVLMRWHELGGHAPETLQALIRRLRDAKRFDQAAEVIESLNWVMPYAVEEHEWLGEHYLRTAQPALALREFQALLALDPDDPAAARLGLARAARQLADQPMARREVLYALEAAPFYRPAQRLLLELNSGDPLD